MSNIIPSVITALVFLVMLLGSSKHRKAGRVLAGSNTTSIRRSAVLLLGMCYQGGTLLLLVGLHKLGISWEQADKRSYNRIHRWVPISRYGNSTPVPIEHRFEEQRKTRNDTAISLRGLAGTGRRGAAGNAGRWAGRRVQPKQPYNPPSEKV